MNYGSSTANRHRGLAFSLLGGLYFALAPLSVSASQRVNVNVSPTTSYYEVNTRTYSAPPSAKVTSGSGVPSVTVHPSGSGGPGLRQSFPSGIEITAVRGGATGSAGISAAVQATGSALKGAAVRCFTSLKCNVAASAAALGLETLFDAVDWVMTDGTLSKPIPGDSVPTEGGGYYYAFNNISGPNFSSVSAACSYRLQALQAIKPSVVITYEGISGGPVNYSCRFKEVNPTTGKQADSYQGVVRRGNGCPAGSTFNSATGSCNLPGKTVPVPAAEIADVINSSYVPHPTDWPFLTGGLDLSDPGVDIKIDGIDLGPASLPSIQYNPDGSSTETSTQFDVTPKNNPSKQPGFDITETTTQTNYSPEGSPLGATTTVTNTTSGGDAAPAPEAPIDCAFMPTVCAFLDWFKEPDSDSSDPYEELSDLVQVYEDPGTTVSIGPFNAVCPAPRTIALTFVPSVEISFQPFCDLATAVRFWLLAIAYFGAAYVTVRSI